jgi:hypothetical protein
MHVENEKVNNSNGSGCRRRNTSSEEGNAFCEQGVVL